MNCVNCGKELKYGDCYTSRIYYTASGFGYTECHDCYFENSMTYSEAIIALKNAAFIGSDLAIHLTEQGVEKAIEALEKADKYDEHLKRIAKRFCEEMTDCFVCPAAGDPHCFNSNKFYEWMKEVE